MTGTSPRGGQHYRPPSFTWRGFDGPADLLLDFAERQRIDLGVMSIQALADWLVIAARLVLLRAQLLFPAAPAEAAKAERDVATELRRLEDVTVVQAAADWLQARPHLGVDVFARPVEQKQKPEGGYAVLMEACLAALRGRRPAQAEPVYRPVIPKLWRVSNAMARI